MAIIILLLGGYLVFDKIINKGENELVENVQDYDLEKAKQLVDKYYKFESVYSFFKTGLTEKQRMVIAFSYLSNEKKLEQSCDSVYASDNNAVKETNWYKINLNNFGETDVGFCDNNTKKVNYDDVNAVYKELFGSNKDIPKGDLSMPLLYDFKDGYFYELSCHCGWTGPNTEIYGIKDAKIVNNKLIINVGYINVLTSNGFYNSITNEAISEDSFRQENFKQNFLNQYLDKMDTYELTFENENGNYVLKDMSKK